jgi:transposase
MKLKEKQYRQIEKLLPIQGENVRINNRQLLAALIYRCENGCSWRDLPKSFSSWYVIYVRLNHRAKNGALQQMHASLTAQG